MKVESKNEAVSTPKGTEGTVSQSLLLINKVIRKSSESVSAVARENRSQSRHLYRIDNLLYLIAISTSIIALAIIVGVVYLLKTLLALLTISFLIAYILGPIVTYFEHRGVNRTLVIVIISLMILGGICSLLIYFANVAYDQFLVLKDQLLAPEFSQQIRDQVFKSDEWLKSRIPMLKNYKLIDQIITEEGNLKIQERIMPAIQGLFSSSKKILPSLISAFTMAAIVPFLTFFILNSGRDLRKMFVSFIPNSIFEPTLLLIDELDKQLGQYIRSRMIIETIFLSILTAIGYWILGLKFFFILGIFAGVANLIPYIGPFIGAIPAIIMAFVGTRFGFTWTIISIVLLSFFVQFIDNAIIFPIFIGKSVDLGPISTTFAVLIGAKLLGLLGLLMAVPIAAMLKVVVSEMYKQFRGYMRT